ncbi:MAG TPA: SMC family ATPase [Thermoplasmata archaeon]|jgi:exonuclease SbcC
MKGADAVEAETVEALEAAPPSEGFVLEEVEMRGFMRYLERTDPPLRFPEKFTVITGRTGAGKSSILDAITFALYGSTARTDIQNVKTSSICRPGGYVRVAFRQGESRWEVKRGFTSRRESYLEVTRDGESVQGTIPEKDQTIREVIGLDYEGFRNSTFVRQEEMKELGAQRGADRLAVFQKLFRLEVFEGALGRAKEQLSSLQTDLRAKDAEIAARQEALQVLPTAREALDGALRELVSRRGAALNLELRVREAEASLKELEADHEAWLRATSAQEDRTSRLGKLAKRIEGVRFQSEETTDLKDELEILEQEVADLDALREIADQLREKSQAHERRLQAAQAAEKLFSQAKKDHERRRDQIKDKIDQLHRKIASLRTDVDRDAAFEFLRDEGRLEERVARIERELEWLADRPELTKELHAERTRTEKALEHVRAKVQSVDADSFVLTELRRQLEELKEELRRETEESHRILKPLDDDKIEALRALDAAPFAEADQRRLADVSQQVQSKAAQRRRADELASRLKEAGDANVLLADLERQRAGLEEETRMAEAAMPGLREREETYRRGKEQLERQRAELDVSRRELHVLEGRTKQLEAQIDALEVDARRLKEAEGQRDELRMRIELMDILVNRVFHKRGVVMYAVDQLLPELEIEASKNLSELTDGRFSRIKLETYEEGRGHGIRIQVQGVDDGWHDVGEFSGGEKTQINAALRFAIARQLASLPQAGRAFGRMKTLFIDEGDLGSLDTEVSRELFVQKLFRMGEFFEKVILITHLQEVADRFPGRIRITMTPNQESRVEVLA